MKNIKKQYKTPILGFTLAELIVVITILSILGTIAFVSFGSYSSQARDSVRISDITNTKRALELFSIKAGSYPIPDGAESFSGGVNNTGSIINQGVLGDNASRNIGLSKTIVDPLTTEKYIYSTFGNGLYYQIASSLENDNLNSFVIPENSKNLSRIQNKNKSSSFLSWIPDFSGMTELEFSNIANAVDNNSSTFKTTKVEGNYKIDPSLPSLIVVPSSVTGSGIFDPSVCFVMNGGVNTTNSGLIVNTITSSSGSCAKKSDMSLKDFDDSLVGYWDMETYYQTTYSGVNNVVFLKDLSGNNYDMFLKELNGFKSTASTSSGSIFTGSVNGKGIYFDSGAFYLTLKTINIPFDTGSIRFVRPDFGNSNYNSLGGELIPGISFVANIDYNNFIGNSWNVKRILTFSKNNSGFIDSGDVGKNIDSSPFRIKKYDDFGNLNPGIHSYILPYNSYSGGLSYGTQGYLGCLRVISGINYTSCDSDFSQKYYGLDISGKNILTSVMNYKSKEVCIYINGNKKFCYPLLDGTINRLKEGGYKWTQFGVSSIAGEGFTGIIDDVKIYNRALSDEEIRQQAKIAGF